ncbi:urease accessory protein UreF [Nibricoccus aquaticus]|uniref:Urease accessory protein UreF n=1 Tax=Nibricoccus aquaticus TaxID=2576891 RepID=A0A290QBS0_9BACT|nr:urease accessory UreF family protein [Nibricoccus aquaticus]ATC62768.1 urease accessory protein UreF [Nibricoccus aquaticus]
MNTETSGVAWLAGMLQMGDTFYPTGAYAHSFGLEGMIELGAVRDRETLREFLLRSALPALRQAELPVVIHAWGALGGGRNAEVSGDGVLDKIKRINGISENEDGRRAVEWVDWRKVGELCVLASALKSAKEARLAAENIGRQRAELAAKLRGHPLAVEFVRWAEAEKWPYSPAAAAALEARVLGAPLEAALASVFYASIAGLMAAAMKLLRLGQNGSQTLLTEMMGKAPEIVAAAKKVPVGEIGWFNPWLDIAAARHERAAARLFIS